MSFPSGSTLKVLLLNGASPNTGPFDLYVNSITASSGILIANDVSKATLSGSGYEFITPIETYQVWAKSDSTITNADVFILGDIPGTNKSISVTGSYDSSLGAGNVTASVFLDNGYGLQNVGTVPSAFNTCPSTIGTGTGSINGTFNTLLVVKDHETGSNYIRFTPNLSTEPVYFYHIPAFSGSGANINSTTVCIDLAGSNYQTVATNSINVYPTASIRAVLSENSTLTGTDNSGVDGWIIINSNGTQIYSGSVAATGSYISVPGNAFIEITSSLLPPSFDPSSSLFYPATSSLDLRWNYYPEYTDQQVYTTSKQEIISGSSQNIITQYSFYAVPGADYSVDVVDTISLAYPVYNTYIRLTAPSSPGDCSSGGLGFYNLQMNTFNFCTATVMTGAVTGLTTNVHYVCYGGQYRQGFHSGTNNFLNGFGSCNACP